MAPSVFLDTAAGSLLYSWTAFCTPSSMSSGAALRLALLLLFLPSPRVCADVHPPAGCVVLRPCCASPAVALPQPPISPNSICSIHRGSDLVRACPSARPAPAGSCATIFPVARGASLLWNDSTSWPTALPNTFPECISALDSVIVTIQG
jgi:hypothetical protein